MYLSPTSRPGIPKWYANILFIQVDPWAAWVWCGLTQSIHTGNPVVTRNKQLSTPILDLYLDWILGISLIVDLCKRDSNGPQSPCTCEILARYHAPGAGWYWNPHTAAINIPIYFLTYIFSHYFKNHIKIFFKNGGHQRDSNHRPIDHESSRLTSTPARVLCRNIAFYPAWTFTE